MAEPPAVTGEVDRPRLTTVVRSLDLPHEEGATRGVNSYPLFRGFTPELVDLSCHVSVLSAGETPHPPHDHAEEEILIMLSGCATLKIEDPDSGSIRPRELEAGSFVYHPRDRKHTLSNTGSVPARYLVFKWRGHSNAAGTDALGMSIHDTGISTGADPVDETPIRTQPIVEEETSHLRRLHCHVTEIGPGAGYAPHRDAHDVAIFVLEGELETLGERVGRNTVVYYAAGEAHGMRNVGESTARYVVFEFHGRRAGFTGRTRMRWLDARRELGRNVWRWGIGMSKRLPLVRAVGKAVYARIKEIRSR